MVIASWTQVLPDQALVERVLEVIGLEIGWLTPRFIPADEYYIVMKLWWRGLTDSMERESCIMSIEDELQMTLPESAIGDLHRMTLGGFLARFRKAVDDDGSEP